MNGTPDSVAPPYTTPIPTANPPESHDYLFVVGFFFTVLFLLTITYVSYKCKNSGLPPTPAMPIIIDGYDDNLIRLSRGLDEDILVTFPTFVYSETTNTHKFDHTVTDADNGSGCAICLEDYKSADVVRLLPECGHMFHVRCIDMWLKTHSTCPVCRNFAGIRLTEENL